MQCVAFRLYTNRRATVIVLTVWIACKAAESLFNTKSIICRDLDGTEVINDATLHDLARSQRYKFL